MIKRAYKDTEGFRHHDKAWEALRDRFRVPREKRKRRKKIYSELWREAIAKYKERRTTVVRRAREADSRSLAIANSRGDQRGLRSITSTVTRKIPSV